MLERIRKGIKIMDLFVINAGSKLLLIKVCNNLKEEL
jgi:hypothetical protein